MRDPRERLRDMLEAIENIERYAIQGRKDSRMMSLFRTGLSTTFRSFVKQHVQCLTI